jgi:hypothetical protein
LTSKSAWSYLNLPCTIRVNFEAAAAVQTTKRFKGKITKSQKMTICLGLCTVKQIITQSR